MESTRVSLWITVKEGSNKITRHALFYHSIIRLALAVLVLFSITALDKWFLLPFDATCFVMQTKKASYFLIAKLKNIKGYATARSVRMRQDIYKRIVCIVQKIFTEINRKKKTCINAIYESHNEMFMSWWDGLRGTGVSSKIISLFAFFLCLFANKYLVFVQHLLSIRWNILETHIRTNETAHYSLSNHLLIISIEFAC